MHKTQAVILRHQVHPIPWHSVVASSPSLKACRKRSPDLRSDTLIMILLTLREFTVQSKR